MTNKKLLLLAPVVIALSVGMSSIPLDASEGDQYDILIKDLRADANQMVFDMNDNYTYNDVQRMQEKHDQKLERILNQLEMDTNRPLSEEERSGLKDYIMHEELKYHSNLLDDTKTTNSTSGVELESNDV